MKKRIFAIAALMLFLCGIGLFVYAVAVKNNGYTPYVILLILPAVVLTVMTRIEKKDEQTRVQMNHAEKSNEEDIDHGSD